MIRLFNVDTLQLAEFPDQGVPQYAILSHRWIPGQELTFNDLNRHLSESTKLLGRKRAGALKLKGACIVARTHGLHWIWIDSCCIDKSNNSELSEAINSMYSWYKHAKICLTYLFDVVLTDSKKTFENSIWFHRCWTLQELIAPHDVEFYDVNWDLIGTKLSLRKSIYDVTGIDMKVLNGGDIDAIPVGRRMSWMSSRTPSGVVASRAATCVEDEAYSLLGIFGVNMPLLYGEKRNAFKRLQEVILETVNDPSIFAWDSSSMAECHEKLNKFRSLQNWDPEKRKLLATKPIHFQTSVLWLAGGTSGTDLPLPSITICDKRPDDSAVLKTVFREFLGLITNSATLAMIIRHCTLKDDKVEAKLAEQLAKQLQVLARRLEHEAQDHHCLNTTRFLHIHASDVAKKAVRWVMDAEHNGRYIPSGMPHQLDMGLSFVDPDRFSGQSQESAAPAGLRRLLEPEAQLDPEYYGRHTYRGMPHRPGTEFSFAYPSIFVASSHSYTLFSQELINTWRFNLWSHSRLREFLGQLMRGGKNRHNRNKQFLQFIELEFDMPMDTPKLLNPQTISVMGRLWHMYELLFGSRTSSLQSIRPGEVHISWKSTMWGLAKTVVIPEELQNEFIELSGEVVNWSKKHNRESLFHKQQIGYDGANFLFLTIPIGSEYHIVRLATHDMTELDLLMQVKDTYAQTRGLLRFWFSVWHLDSLKLALNGPNSAKVLHQSPSPEPKGKGLAYRSPWRPLGSLRNEPFDNLYEYQLRELDEGDEDKREFHGRLIRQLLLRIPQRYHDLDSSETSQESFIGLEVVERLLPPIPYLVLFSLCFLLPAAFLTWKAVLFVSTNATSLLRVGGAILIGMSYIHLIQRLGRVRH